MQPWGYTTANHSVRHGSPDDLTRGQCHGFAMEHIMECPMVRVRVRLAFSMARPMGRTMPLIIRGLYHGLHHGIFHAVCYMVYTMEDDGICYYGGPQ